MPEETTGLTPPNDRYEALVSRLDRIEREALRENRWWRGGLIAALVLLALSLFFAGHRRHRHPPGPPPPMAFGPMYQPGWQGGMPYGQFRPYDPPPWAFGPRGQWGCGPGSFGGQRFHRFGFQPWDGNGEQPPPPPQGPPTGPKQ